MNEIQRAQIIITAEYESHCERLKETLAPSRVVCFVKEDILIEDAKAAIAEAYISESQTKYIILATKSINAVAQNALLKVLEEPPNHIEFIIIVPSKSTLLATIRSRLPIRKMATDKTALHLDLQLKNLELQTLFAFVKTHERLKKHEAKALIETLFKHATQVEKIKLSQKQLDAFAQAYRLIELNGRFQVILLHLLMLFVGEKRHAY